MRRRRQAPPTILLNLQGATLGSERCCRAVRLFGRQLFPGRFLRCLRVGGLARLAVLASAGLLTSAGLLALAVPAAAQPSPAPPVVIDGPSSAIQSLGGMSVARDGTGGLIYLKTVGGVPKVFLSVLSGGQFQTPVQLDAGLGGASSQPVIAAGNGGVLLIGFINAGGLYVVDRTSATSSLTAPSLVAGGASNPSIQMSNFGKGYLAFTVADGSGFDVRDAYWYNGWSLEASPLNAVPADDAGTGTGRPAVAAAGDGVAIVVWGEDGHIYSRRVWGTAPSVVDYQADTPSVSGCGEVSAGDPDVSAGGDSSYVDVVYQETVSCGGVQQDRVLVNRLQADQYNGATGVDNLSSPGAGGGDEPQVAMTEYGQGFVTAAQETTNNVFAMELGNNGAYGNVLQVNSLAATGPPYAVPGVAGLFSTMVAWQQTPGSAGPSEIRVRYEPKASSLGPELVVSSPADGATDAADGLAAGGDVSGDAAFAWVQGTGASSEIVAEQMYQPPGAVAPSKSSAYDRTAQPVVSWAASNSRWGPVKYTITVDGSSVLQTTSTSARLPALQNGSHRWQVTATNPAGVTSTSKAARLFVDTVAPTASFGLSGTAHAGATIDLTVRYRDLPPHGLPQRDASGVAKITIRWGDGTVATLKPGSHRSSHAYRRPGRYKVTVVVEDRVGNEKTIVKVLKIAAAGKP
jgi:hypothetical protein